MSLFKYERPSVGKVNFQPVATPAGPDLQDGDFWYDATQKNMIQRVNGFSVIDVSMASVNQTPVTATNPNPGPSNLMSYVVPAGSANTLGKVIDLFCTGFYTTASAQTPTITIAVKMGSVTIATWTTGATTASATNMPFNFDLSIITSAIGSSGTVIAHGVANVTLGASAGGAETSYNDTNSASSSAIDLTAAETIQVVVSMSSSNAGNSVTQDTMQVTIGN